jgi:hypothetical protein
MNKLTKGSTPEMMTSFQQIGRLLHAGMHPFDYIIAPIYIQFHISKGFGLDKLKKEFSESSTESSSST